MHLLSIYKSGAVCICAPSSVCVNKLNNQSCLTPEIEKKQTNKNNSKVFLKLLTQWNAETVALF